MRKVVVVNNLSLDGVMQAPAAKNEDTRGGFQLGGWSLPYNDDVKAKVMGQGMAKKSAMLFGRRTYEHMYKAWHGRTDGNPFTPVLDNAEKFVTSRTLKAPLAWQNSTLLAGDAADSVAALKNEDGPDLVILGSGELIRSLMTRKLIDELQLIIHPLVLGSGRRMFADESTLTKFTLTNSVPTTTGAIIATYSQADAS
jgi:dihydrofolate reductase